MSICQAGRKLDPDARGRRTDNKVRADYTTAVIQLPTFFVLVRYFFVMFPLDTNHNCFEYNYHFLFLGSVFLCKGGFNLIVHVSSCHVFFTVLTILTIEWLSD